MRSMSAQTAAVTAAVWCLAAAAATAASAAPPDAPPGPGSSPSAGSRTHIAFRIAVPYIKESSSLVVSSAHPGLVYTTNDSGDGPYVYVLDRQGHLVGTTTLAGVDPTDIEAMSGGSDGSLVVADIGDNRADRSTVDVYRIPEPTTGDHIVTPDKVTLTYPDGPRDAESVLYDADSGAVLVVSKEPVAHVYSTPRHVFSTSSATLRRVATAPSSATDASWLPANGSVVVRTYLHAVIYRYPSWKLERVLTLPLMQQGESISRVPGRPRVVWAGTEGVDSPVWEVSLPKLPVVPGYHEASASPTPASPSSPPPTGPTLAPRPAQGGTGARPDGTGAEHSTTPRTAMLLLAVTGVIAVGAVATGVSRLRRRT